MRAVAPLCKEGEGEGLEEDRGHQWPQELESPSQRGLGHQALLWVGLLLLLLVCHLVGGEGREGGKGGGEGGREEGKEGREGREGGREEGREEGKEGREGREGREGGRESDSILSHHTHMHMLTHIHSSVLPASLPASPL